MHLLFLLGFYFLPYIVARSRHSFSSGGVLVVNLLFGWTGIGWIAAMIWAVLSPSWDYRYCARPGYPVPYQPPYYRSW